MDQGNSPVFYRYYGLYGWKKKSRETKINLQER